VTGTEPKRIKFRFEGIVVMIVKRENFVINYEAQYLQFNFSELVSGAMKCF
jgi:hypothetical protein